MIIYIYVIPYRTVEAELKISQNLTQRGKKVTEIQKIRANLAENRQKLKISAKFDSKGQKNY